MNSNFNQYVNKKNENIMKIPYNIEKIENGQGEI